MRKFKTKDELMDFLGSCSTNEYLNALHLVATYRRAQGLNPGTALAEDDYIAMGLVEAPECSCAQEGGVWVELTDTKCRTASAWIRDIIMPTGEVPECSYAQDGGICDSCDPDFVPPELQQVMPDPFTERKVGKAPELAAPYGVEQEEPKIDYMKAVRDMCGG